MELLHPAACMVHTAQLKKYSGVESCRFLLREVAARAHFAEYLPDFVVAGFSVGECRETMIGKATPLFVEEIMTFMHGTDKRLIVLESET